MESKEETNLSLTIGEPLYVVVKLFCNTCG